MAYLALGCFTSLLIILVIVFGTYGSNISKDPTFISFFKWYIFLFVFNLFNILVTLIFHYIMAEIPGVQGLKGYTGDKGLPGESGKCFCDTDKDGTPENIKSLDITDDIHTRDFIEQFASGDRIGTMIYHGDESTSLNAEALKENKECADAADKASEDAASAAVLAADAKLATNATKSATAAAAAAAAATAEKYKKIIKYFMNATVDHRRPSVTIRQAWGGVVDADKLEELGDYLVNTDDDCKLYEELSATNCNGIYTL